MRLNDNYDVFIQVFQSAEFKASTPVLIMDQDMHAIALAAATAGFTVSALEQDVHFVRGS